MPPPDAALEAVQLSSPLLSAVRRLTALDTVRARIAMAVDLGLLRPEERLPDSRAIADALDVSEVTVRRALISLTEDGILIRRRGRTGGTYVAPQPARGAVPEVIAYESATDEVRRLIDQRLVVESGVAVLAARVAKAAGIRKLDRLVLRMESAATWAQFHRLDEAFHLAVAEITDIPTAAAQLRTTLHELYRFYLPYPLEYLRGSNDEHRALVAALRDHDPAAAVEITNSHVTCLYQTMFIGLTPT